MYSSKIGNVGKVLCLVSGNAGNNRKIEPVNIQGLIFRLVFNTVNAV